MDHNGRNLAEAEDEDNTIGLLEFGGYRWNEGTPYMAPGHNSVLRDADGSGYLVRHIRDLNFSGMPEPSTMQVRKICWMPDGWPVVSAEPYAGEREQQIPTEELPGYYEIFFTGSS